MSADAPVLTGRAAILATWMARGLAVLIGVFQLFILMDAINKLQKLPLPFVLAGAPLGTYEQTTQLGYLVMLATAALFLAGALAAFRWEKTAGRIFLACAATQLLSLVIRSFDPTFPRANLLWWLALSILPSLLIAALLIQISQKGASSYRRVSIPNQNN